MQLNNIFNDTIHSRPATIFDAIAIAELACQLGYPTTISKAATRLAHLLNKSDNTVLVAVTKLNVVIGWIHVFGAYRIESDPFAEIGGLVVDQSHRNHGVGKDLVEAAIEWARNRGYHSLKVRSNVIRAGAHKFYAREGFSLVKNQGVFEINLYQPLKDN